MSILTKLNLFEKTSSVKSTSTFLEYQIEAVTNICDLLTLNREKRAKLLSQIKELLSVINSDADLTELDEILKEVPNVTIQTEVDLFIYQSLIINTLLKDDINTFMTKLNKEVNAYTINHLNEEKILLNADISKLEQIDIIDYTGKRFDKILSSIDCSTLSYTFKVDVLLCLLCLFFTEYVQEQINILPITHDIGFSIADNRNNILTIDIFKRPSDDIINKLVYCHKIKSNNLNDLPIYAEYLESFNLNISSYKTLDRTQLLRNQFKLSYDLKKQLPELIHLYTDEEIFNYIKSVTKILSPMNTFVFDKNIFELNDMLNKAYRNLKITKYLFGRFVIIITNLYFLGEHL